MAGVIDGMNRGPKSPPRLRRAAAKLALTDPDQIQIRGTFNLPVVQSPHADTTDLPTSPDDGQVVFLYIDSADPKLCIAHGGSWFSIELEAMS